MRLAARRTRRSLSPVRGHLRKGWRALPVRADEGALSRADRHTTSTSPTSAPHRPTFPDRTMRDCFRLRLQGSEPGASTRTRPALTWMRTVATDVEDAAGLACGFVAGPGGPRIDADAREGLLRHVLVVRSATRAPALMGRGGDGTIARCTAHLVPRACGGSDARVAQTGPW